MSLRVCVRARAVQPELSRCVRERESKNTDLHSFHLRLKSVNKKISHGARLSACGRPGYVPKYQHGAQVVGGGQLKTRTPTPAHVLVWHSMS